MTWKTYCGNLLWQSGLTLLVPEKGNEKMRLKKWLMLAVLAMMSILSFGALTVSDITAKQRYPWNGLVDIAFTVSGSLESGEANEVFTIAAKRSSGGAAIPISALAKADGANVVEVVASGADGWMMTLTGSGTGRLIWNTASDVTGSKISAIISINALELDDAGGVLWEGGPSWASCNLGANKPEEAGLYFWWGDTTGYSPSSDGTFSFNFSGTNSTIYTWGQAYSTIPADAAKAKLGGSWRMPTDQEFDDLDNKCDWTWISRNGMNGYRVRGRGTYASRSIFLPAAGRGYGTSLNDAGANGYYWSSVPYSDSSYYYYGTRFLYFGSGSHGPSGNYGRYLGLSVRPVQGFTN